MTETIKKTRFTNRDFGLAQFRRNSWHLTLSEAQTIDDVLVAGLWKDILGKPTRGDVVEAWKPDSGEWTKFVITEAGEGFIKLGKVESFTPPVVSIPDGAIGVRWNVGKRAFDIIRTSDNFVMARDFQTKESAAKWIADHNKKMAA